MKSLTIALTVTLLVLSTCAVRTRQIPDSQFQRSPVWFSQPDNVPIGRSLSLQPTRKSIGGIPPNTSGISRGGFSDYPARSLWGGYPLNSAGVLTTTPASPAPLSFASASLAPSCESTDNFCVIQHRFPFQRPFSSIFNTAVESSYLYGTTQFGSLDPHHGIEILNPTGTPVLAADDGTVVVAGDDAHRVFGPWEDFYGNLVVLEHHLPGIDMPIYTLYGHLSTIDVQVGQEVKGGKLIGEVGATGTAIGSHLHFEVRMGTNHYNNTRNPALWLSPYKDESGQQFGALAGKFNNPQGEHIYFTIKAEYYPDVNEEPEKVYFIETYATEIDPIKSDDKYQENFVLTDLPPGHYRIALSASGKWIERWVEVEPGKLSFVTIVSK